MRESKGRLSSKKRRERQRVVLTVLVVVLVFSVLLLRIWISSKAVELAYDIECLASERKELEEGNRKLSLEIARLRSPQRISRIARGDLKMVRSSDARVIVLEK